MSAIGDDWFKFENVKFLAPALGTAAAIVFDVGYFTGIDLSFFTLFSLSEHVVFAVRAFPAAVTVVVLFYLYVGLLAWWARRRLEGLSPFAVWGFFAIMLALVFGLAITKAYAGAIFFAVIALFIFIAFRMLAWQRRSHRLLLAAVAGNLAVAFFFGFAFANLQPIGSGGPHMLRDKDGTTTRGLLIVAGERGVLFGDTAGTIQFRKWDSIDKIERGPRGTSSPR